MARSNTVDILFRLKDEVSKKLADMDTAVNKFGNNLKSVFTSSVRSSLPAELDFIADGLDKIPLGATAAAGALIGIGKAAIDMAEDVERSALAYDKLSQKTGASVEFLSGFTAAADDMRVSSETVNQSLVKYSRYLAQTEGPSANVEASLMKMADQFRNMADGPEKTALAMQAFGRAGAEMIPILNQGSEAIKTMMTDAANMGQVISTQTTMQAKALHDQMDALNDRVEGLKTRLGSGVLPALNITASGFEAMAQKADSAGGPIEQLNSALRTLGPNAVAAGLNITLMGAQAAQAAQVTMQAAQMAAAASSILAAAAGGAAGVMTTGLRTAADLTAQANRIGDVFDRSGYKWEKATAAAAAQETAQRKLATATSGTNRELNDYNDSQDEYTQIAMESQRITLEHEDAMRKLGHSAGGAAKQVDLLAESEDNLKKAIDNVGNMLGQSTSDMSATARVQKAYAIATGQASKEQFQQEEAVKALMKAVEDGAVSQDKATTTAVAMAQGVADASDAFTVAGAAGEKFRAEYEQVATIADAANGKVNEMKLAIKNLPPNTKVNVAATIQGMDMLREAKTIVAALDAHERRTIEYNVVYSVSVSGTVPTGLPAPGSGAGGGSGGGASSGGTPTDYNDSPPGGRDTGGGDNNGAGRRKGGGSSESPLVILNMDARAVARAVAPYLKLA